MVRYESCPHNNDVQFCNTTNLDNELQNNLEENENNNDTLNYIPSNIYDSGNWKNIDTKLRDLLVERGPIRDNDIIFPRGDDTRQEK